ncbi:MAG: hypothetical protein IKS08_03135 [Alphaproteobacteria bacterium]|nr:hypothetical protein [Alphaproteobacteria bacterium]
MGKFNFRKHALAYSTIALLVAMAAIKGGGKIVQHIKERKQAKIEAAEEREWQRQKEQERIADSIARAERQQRDDYYEQVRDSVAEQNGARRYGDSLRSERDDFEDEEAIRTIEWAHSLAGTMERELMTAGKPIIQHGEQEIRDLLAKYNVSYTDFFANDEYNWYLREELFIGVSVREDGQVWQMFGATAEWQAHVDAIIDKSEYGEPRKAEMKQKVAEIIAGTEQKLIASRKNVQKRFADYYSALPQEYKDYIGVESLGEGEMGPGYDESLNYYANAGGIVTSREIHVYDSNLDPDFFGEPGATYKLVSLGNNKWQVVKTRADGTVAKTAVFQDKGSIYTYTNTFGDDTDEEGNPIPVPKVGDSYFDFRPGANIGVHISFNEVIKVEKHNKQWKTQFTESEQRQMDSLRERIAKKSEWSHKQWELGRQSDSIARAMTQRRFGNRGQ